LGVSSTDSSITSDVCGRDGGIDGVLLIADTGREGNFDKVVVDVFCCDDGGREVIAFCDALREIPAEEGIAK